MFRFVDKQNNVAERRIVKERIWPSNGHPSLHGYDLVVGMLDSDVPAFSRISFAKVLPKNLTTVRPTFYLRVPVFDTDFEEKALAAVLSYESGTMVSLKTPLSSSYRHQYFETKKSVTVEIRCSSSSTIYWFCPLYLNMGAPVLKPRFHTIMVL